MSSQGAPVSWKYDHRRRQYCFWDSLYNAWHYQAGFLVYQDGTQQVVVPPSSTQTDASQPRSDPAAHLTTTGYSYRPSVDSGDPAYGLSRQFSQLHTNDTGHHAVAPEVYQIPGSPLLMGPAEAITEPSLLRDQIHAYAKLPATEGDHETLDRRFRVRSNPNQFFSFGKVFKVLWPEPAGNVAGTNATVVTDTLYRNEQFISKIRWFVVVREGALSCSCLSVSTYGRKGVGKGAAIPSHHSIIYTGKEPSPLDTEKPQKGEQGMLSPIEVVPTCRGSKKDISLDPVSRLNFEKIYTVEHNVKVFDFGNVHKRHHKRLRRQWLDIVSAAKSRGQDSQEEESETEEGESQDE